MVFGVVLVLMGIVVISLFGNFGGFFGFYVVGYLK